MWLIWKKISSPAPSIPPQQHCQQNTWPCPTTNTDYYWFSLLQCLGCSLWRRTRFFLGDGIHQPQTHTNSHLIVRNYLSTMSLRCGTLATLRTTPLESVSKDARLLPNFPYHMRTPSLSFKQHDRHSSVTSVIDMQPVWRNKVHVRGTCCTAIVVVWCTARFPRWPVRTGNVSCRYWRGTWDIRCRSRMSINSSISTSTRCHLQSVLGDVMFTILLCLCDIPKTLRTFWRRNSHRNYVTFQSESAVVRVSKQTPWTIQRNFFPATLWI